MKIQTIEAILVSLPYTTGGSEDAEAWGGKAWRTADTLLVKITTDEGLIGWGEAFGYNAIPATRAAIDHMVAPLCIGRDPLQIEPLLLELQQKLHIFGRGGPVTYALSGIDIALWDIAGKAAGKPVHHLLGGCRAATLPCYASLIRYTEPKVVAANTERALRQGFRNVKLHEIEVNCVRAAREAAGDDVEIMLDVNCPWSVREALDMAKQLRPLNLRWLEEPVWPPENYSGLARVRAEGGIPIAAGENASTVMDFQHLLEAKAVDFIQPSPAKMGGLTELSKVSAMANANNTTVRIHTFYDGPGLLAAIHANAALGGAGAMVEWRYFDLEEQLYGDAIIPKNGVMAVPQGPGLGFEPRADVIRKYRAS